MSNRNILLLSLSINLAVTLGLSVSFYLGVKPTRVEQRQVAASRQTIAELRSLQACTTRLFKEAAERIVLGVEEDDEIATALERAEQSLDRLQDLNAAERRAAEGEYALEEEKEGEELLKIREQYESLIEQIESTIVMGNTDAELGIEFLLECTEEGYDDLLAPMIESAIEIEKQQKLRRQARLETAVSGLKQTAVAGGATVLFVLMLASSLILRSFKQVGRLTGQLSELAFRDALTGLPNRSSALCSIQHTIDQGGDGHYALLFLDFDRFKLINDSLGHDVGDELLKDIARRLSLAVGPTDKVLSARLGGDEFVVLLDSLDNVSDATDVAENLLQVFSDSYEVGPHTVYSTASIGVATSEQRYESAGEMLRDADLAMYAAKAAGKACYAVFDQTMRDNVKSRLLVESELREVISRRELDLLYQPIVSLESGDLKGVEALVRWMHPQHGLICPDEFVPVAEETGLIVSIGTWVLDESCRQLAQWRQSLGEAAPQSISVNVSRKQLLDPNLVSIIEQTIKKYMIPPECLHLEVTETVIMHDTKPIVATLCKLRDLGVKIDLDDFGTGYSSLSCLHEFPIDVLKIDRLFIANVKDNREYVALLHAILTLADTLNLRVVSEGIENRGQLDLLRELGCQYGQGYHFAQPLTFDDIEKYVGSKDMRSPIETEVMPRV